jgi:arginine N-succinyltransferase
LKIIRPIALADLPSLVTLVTEGGSGLTTLPPDAERLARRIAASEASFAGRSERPEETYLFAMQDVETGRLAGVCGIDAAIGLRQAWYSYRVGLAVHASKEFGIFTQTQTLFLANDLTGQSELCSLLLHPDYRKGGMGSLLSKSRFLFMAEHRARFGAKVIAELRGVSDANGRSPFWESLGRRFFSMDFSRADYLTGIGHKSFVAELMPKHPLYTSFLAPEAQAVIGQTHSDTAPARRLLEQEGFRYEGHVDIFDAGPVLEIDVDDVSAIRKSRHFTAAVGTPAGEVPWLVSNTAFAGYRASVVKGGPSGDSFALPAATLAALGLEAGGTLRAVALAPADRTS